MNNFENKILLSIKRAYSKDEKFQFVLAKLKEAEIEKGMLKSELSEKEAEIKLLNKKNYLVQKKIKSLRRKLRIARKILNNYNKAKESDKTIQSLRIDKKELQKKFYKYQNECLNLKLKLERISKQISNV